MDDRIVAANIRQNSSAGVFCFSVLTPAGRGAIASIGLSGGASLASLDRLFTPASGRPLSTYPPGSVVYGRFRSSNNAGEDVVVGIFADGEVEIHSHGGRAALAAICDELTRQGGVQQRAPDWARPRSADSIAADALLALADAKTARAAAILLDQYRGALSRELQSIDLLISAGNPAAASHKIGELLSRADLGLHLTEPWKIVLTGCPNVGKSSLMNALLGYERSIVWHQPGTTRDVLTASTAIDGWWVELSDVAGLRRTHDALEAAGVSLAQQQIAAADLVIFVSDVTRDWDADLHDEVCKRRATTHIARQPIIVHNKCDLLQSPTAIRPAGIETSALTGVGIPRLCEVISKSLVPSSPNPGTPIPFTQDHRCHLRDALTALNYQHHPSAQNSIQF